MSDFLSQLIQRHLEPTTGLQPRLPGLFEPPTTAPERLGSFPNPALATVEQPFNEAVDLSASLEPRLATPPARQRHSEARQQHVTAVSPGPARTYSQLVHLSPLENPIVDRNFTSQKPARQIEPEISTSGLLTSPPRPFLATIEKPSSLNPQEAAPESRRPRSVQEFNAFDPLFVVETEESRGVTAEKTPQPITPQPSAADPPIPSALLGEVVSIYSSSPAQPERPLDLATSLEPLQVERGEQLQSISPPGGGMMKPVQPIEPVSPPQTIPTAAPIIRVNIGRIEVHAIPSTVPTRSRPKAPRKSPALSLDTYLKRRREGS